jgi:hypothetical protein
MIKADGSETKYPIMSGFGEDAAKQQMKGKACVAEQQRRSKIISQSRQ